MNGKKIRCIIVEDETYSRQKLNQFLSDELDAEVVAQCGTGKAAIEEITQKQPDVVFLDIEMPDIDGFEVLRHLPINITPAFIFVTAFDHYALKAFDCEALDFLLKPFDRRRFQKTMTRVRRKISEYKLQDFNQSFQTLLDHLQNKDRFLCRIMVKENDILIPVETKDICKIESAKNYVHIHTASAKYTLRKQLSELSPHLDPAQFIRIDRSLIVNINKIAQIQPLFKGNSTLVLKNNDKIPLGKRNSNRIRDSLDTLNRKKK